MRGKNTFRRQVSPCSDEKQGAVPFARRRGGQRCAVRRDERELAAWPLFAGGARAAETAPCGRRSTSHGRRTKGAKPQRAGRESSVIITELTPSDAPRPTHTIAKANCIEDYASAGREAGDTAGREYREAFGIGSKANPAFFDGGLARALQSAREHMASTGASEEAVALWQREFDAAFKPHILTHIQVMTAWHKPKTWHQATQPLSPMGAGDIFWNSTAAQGALVRQPM